MKRKVTRLSQASTPEGRRLGKARFRVTGPCKITGERVVLEVECHRSEAESIALVKEGLKDVS